MLYRHGTSKTLTVNALASCLFFPAALLGEVPVEWGVGDLFIGVGGGSYQVFDPQGGLKQTLTGVSGGYTTGCSFSPEMDQLYTTNYTNSQVVVFEDNPEPSHVIHTGQTSPGGHSSAVVFDAEGRFFVGHPDGNQLIHKYDDVGMLMETYQVEVEKHGPGSLDLSADRNTLFYTAAGRKIHRFDTASNRQLSAFAELPGTGRASALRLLAPGDGSGGLLVADGTNIKRLDANGEVTRIYDDKGQDSWFALNLDPNGTSFWAADGQTDRLYRFHINTGAIEQQIQAGAGRSIFGVCLKGEPATGAMSDEMLSPHSYRLAQNTPNPFNPSTQIEFQMPEPGHARLVIYNLLGQEIRTLVQGAHDAGIHIVEWHGDDASGLPVSSGVYFYRFESRGLVETRTMTLLK